MKLADATPLIWLIVFVMVAIGKGLSKLQQSTKDDSSTEDDAPPVVRPRPRIPQPRPPPVMAPMARPAPKAGSRMPTPPRTSTPTPRGRNVDADGIRRFVEQLGGKPQPPVTPAPARKAAPPPAPPRRPEPVAQTTDVNQQIAATSAPTQTSRASQWTEALRDRNNVRNIIISAEIIGPPRSESV
jgi:hypothetical protein